MTGKNRIIEANNVVCVYGKTVALDGVSFAIDSPTITGIVGKNGAGKSTLLRLLSGREKPKYGAVTVNGKSPYDNGGVLRDMIFTDEKTEFDFTLSLGGILDKCAFLDKRFDIDGARGMAERFGLPLKKRFSQLSKGMKSQFVITAALAFNRPITIMDEPISGLDDCSRRLFYSMLIKSYNTVPRMFIISTHLLNEFERYADSFMVISKGKIAAYDSREAFETLFVKISGRKENVDMVTAGWKRTKKGPSQG